MKYYSAWVEIAGKVYVDIYDMQERMEQKFPECVKIDADGEKEYDFSIDEEKIVFEELAGEKISEFFNTDDPIKMKDYRIDLSTYRS